MLPRPSDDPGTTLDALPPGASGTVVSLPWEREVRERLYALGILEGQRVRVLRRAPMGGALLVAVGTSQYALGPEIASRIRVSRG